MMNFISRKIKQFRSVFILTISIFYSSTTFAHASIEEAEQMVDHAIQYFQQNGEQRAFQAFNNPQEANGKFFNGELYIFSYDLQGNCMALGGNPKMVGKNLINMKSADGKYYLKEMITAVSSLEAKGLIAYRWTHPESRKMQNKLSIVKRIPNTNYFVGCGIYSEK